MALCRVAIVRELLPQLLSRFESILGRPDISTRWSLRSDDHDPQTINFSYPSGSESGKEGSQSSYVRSVVQLEFGARSDHWPAAEHRVRPYAAEVMPEQFREADCRVNTLSAERTFWEKATLLHAEAHRPQQKPLGDRMSRHYYDVAKLYQSSFGPKALADCELLKSVVMHKSLFFHSSWANYQSAIPGTFRLIPDRERLAALAADYRAMQENMIFGAAYGFGELMAVLAELEAKINARVADQ